MTVGLSKVTKSNGKFKRVSFNNAKTPTFSPCEACLGH